MKSYDDPLDEDRRRETAMHDRYMKMLADELLPKREPGGAARYWFENGAIHCEVISPEVFSAPVIDPAAAERTRILAAIKELKPPHRKKTHGDWARAWKEAGELAMYELVIAAIGGDK